RGGLRISSTPETDMRQFYTWEFSPDRSRIAVGGGELGALCIVDVARMRQLGRIRGSAAAPLAWPTKNRLLAVEQWESDATGRPPDGLVVINPLTRRVVARRSLGGNISKSARANGRLVLLLGSQGGIAGTRIALVDRNG